MRLLLLPLLAAALPAQPQSPAAEIGKQRAVMSPVEWEIREAGHPALGNIRFAYIKRPVETRVGSLTVYSRAYLSCQKGKRSFAIELANAMAPADPGGLRPAADPRLVCQRPEDGKLLREEILASWDINPKIGDAMTRGLRGFPLRECVAISVQQEVFLPEGSAQKTARLEFEILPYDRELDSVFATCGEPSAYAPAAPAVAAAPAASAAVKPAKAQPAQDGWREARSVASGKTNVRRGPTLQSAIVATLHPGSVVMVQRTETEWWRARGKGFEGYIRQDRLVLK